MQFRYMGKVSTKQYLFQWIITLSLAFLLGACQQAKQTNTVKYSAPPSNRDIRFSQTVKDIQHELTQKKYSPGPVDGILGKKTRAALKVFQKNNELPITGRMDTLSTKLLLSGMGIGLSLSDQQPPKMTTAVSIAPPVPELSVDATVKQESDLLQKDAIVIKKGIVNEETSIMKDASIFSDVIMEVIPGTSLEVLGNENDFIEVQYEGVRGYVFSDYVDIVN